MWWKRKRNTCGHWDCDKRLRDNQFLCEEHHQDWEEGTLDRCPKCGQFKDMQYYLCLDDYYGRRVARWEPPVAIPAPKQNYRVEFSEAIEQDGDGQQHGDPVLMLPGPAGGLCPGGSEIQLPGPGLSEVYAGSDRPALIAGVGKAGALAVR